MEATYAEIKEQLYSTIESAYYETHDKITEDKDIIRDNIVVSKNLKVNELLPERINYYAMKFGSDRVASTETALHYLSRMRDKAIGILESSKIEHGIRGMMPVHMAILRPFVSINQALKDMPTIREYEYTWKQLSKVYISNQEQRQQSDIKF